MNARSLSPDAKPIKNTLATLDVHAREELQEPGLSVAARPPVAATATSQVTLELAGQLGGDVNDVVVRDSTAYVGVGPRLVILDVSDLANPTRVGERLVVRHGAQRSGPKPHSSALRARLRTQCNIASYLAEDDPIQ